MGCCDTQVGSEMETCVTSPLVCGFRGSLVKEAGTWGGNERVELCYSCESSELPPDTGQDGHQ